MFANSLRTAALSLAVAAVAAAVTLTTAVAAPIPAAGASAAEAVGARTEIKLPMANVVVTKKSKEGDPYQSQKYLFDVKNFGPDAANVKIKKHATWFTSTGTLQEKEFEYTATLGVGGMQTVQVDCDPPPGGYCYAGSVRATVIGIDPNTSNNVDFYSNPLP